MDLKEFTFRLIILFFPGLLAFMIFDRLTVHRKVEPFFFGVNSFVFGIVAYFLTWALSLSVFPAINAGLNTLHAQWQQVPTIGLPEKMAVWENLKDSSKGVELGEMAWTCGVAVFLALGSSWASNHKVLYRVARRFGIGRKSGEMDVWAFVMNSRDDAFNFVTLRDVEADLAYDGWIHSFSEDHTTTELLLGDVAVYRNSTSLLLYQIGAMYFKVDPTKVILEFRGKPVTEKHKVNMSDTHEQPQPEPAATVHQRGATEEGRGESNTHEPTSSATTSAAASEQAASSATKEHATTPSATVTGPR